LKKMNLTILFPVGSERMERTGLLLAYNLKEIGLNAKLRGQVWTMLCELASKPETTPEMTINNVGAKYPSPDMHTYMMFHPSAHGTFQSMSHYNNPKVTALIEKARATAEAEERYRLYGEAQKIITDDAPVLFMANPPHRRAIKSDIKGYKYVGISGFELNFYTLRLEK